MLTAVRRLIADVKNILVNINGVLVVGTAALTTNAPCGPVGLAIGSTKPRVANALCYYMINGKVYSLAANAVGTVITAQTIPQGLYGAMALDVDVNGSITVVPATLNTTGYSTAAKAVAGLPACNSAKCRLGYITGIQSGAAGWVAATDNLDLSGQTTAYTDATTFLNSVLASFVAACPTLTQTSY